MTTWRRRSNLLQVRHSTGRLGYPAGRRLAVRSGAAIFLLLGLFASPAWAASNVLTWTDNSTNEANFEIFSKIIPSPPLPAVITNADCVANVSPFAQLATVGANIVTFTHAGVTEGLSYCYEVRATNTAGASAFSNQAGRTVPFTVPNAPSGAGVAGGP